MSKLPEPPPPGYLLDELGYVDEIEAATALALAPKTLTDYRKNGVGPEYTELARKILYSRDALAKWLAAGGTKGTGVLIAAWLLLSAPVADAQTTLRGAARVIDSDTVVIAGTTHVRLKGVDGAALRTARGEYAKRVMIEIIGGDNLICELTGEKTHRRDVGFCRTASGIDINKEIISRGAALACARYSMRYVSDEKAEALAVQPRSSYCVKR